MPQQEAYDGIALYEMDFILSSQGRREPELMWGTEQVGLLSLCKPPHHTSSSNLWHWTKYQKNRRKRKNGKKDSSFGMKLSAVRKLLLEASLFMVWKSGQLAIKRVRSIYSQSASMKMTLRNEVHYEL